MIAEVKVRPHEIPEEGVTLSERFDPVEKSLQTEQLKFAAPVAVTATFHLESNTVLVEVEAEGDLKLTCGRCLEEYPQPFLGHFDLDYDVEGIKTLDVTDDIRQEILLSYPIRYLCREECQGLCARCGFNLNQGTCTCKEKSHATT